MRKMIIIWISLRAGFTVQLPSSPLLFRLHLRGYAWSSRSLLIRHWHRDNVTDVTSRAEWLRSVSVLNPSFLPSQHSRSLTPTLELGSITRHTDSKSPTQQIRPVDSWVNLNPHQRKGIRGDLPPWPLRLLLAWCGVEPSLCYKTDRQSVVETVKTPPRLSGF